MNTSTTSSIVNSAEPNPFAKLNLLKVDEHSITPKYLQIVDIILSDIENGIFKIGEQIPSINETSAEFYMARDTVEKAYKVLKEKGIITSVKRKGYFVSSTGKMASKRILMILNDINHDKRQIFDAFVDRMPANSEVDLFLFNGQIELLQKCLIKNKGHYDHFVLLPQFDACEQALEQTLSLVAREKLLLIQTTGQLVDGFAGIVQNTKKDIYGALTEVQSSIRKYTEIRLLVEHTSLQNELIEGFVDFCADHKIRFSVHDRLEVDQINKGQLYLTMSEHDLVSIIKTSKSLEMEIGKDIGLISYNDSDLKEVLCGGITVFTPAYDEIGREAADFIINKRLGTKENAFRVIARSSI